MSATHRHYTYIRAKRRGMVTEHPVEQPHQYLYGAFPLDTEFHPRPPGEPNLDVCRVPETDDELLFLLRRSIEQAKERKRG